MSMDKATVAKIASLARIRLSDAEQAGYARELSQIIDWVETLGEVDVEGVEPMTSVVHLSLRQREDTVTDGDIHEDILANAPEATGGFFTVPKVVE